MYSVYNDSRTVNRKLSSKTWCHCTLGSRGRLEDESWKYVDD